MWALPMLGVLYPLGNPLDFFEEWPRISIKTTSSDPSTAPWASMPDAPRSEESVAPPALICSVL